MLPVELHLNGIPKACLLIALKSCELVGHTVRTDTQVWVLRFVSCAFWDGVETTCWVARYIAGQLKKAWLQRNG